MLVIHAGVGVGGVGEGRLQRGQSCQEELEPVEQFIPGRGGSKESRKASGSGVSRLGHLKSGRWGVLLWPQNSSGEYGSLENTKYYERDS